MSRWSLKAIEEVCVVNPRLPRGHSISDDKAVSFVPMAAIDEVLGSIASSQVRTFSEVKKGYTHFMDNDVLFAKITPCMENGKAAIAKNLAGGLGFGSTEFHVLRSKGEVLPDWLFYFVRQPHFRAEAKRNFTGTAGQQRVPTTFLASALIPVPHLEEQRRIVDILSRAEGIVRLRRDAEKKAAELIPALFLDMFGDPATNPKGWPVKSLGELIIDGPQNGLYKHASLYGEGTPILRIDGFYDGLVVNLNALKRVRITPEEQQRFRLKERDIVINRVNSVEYLGKSAIIPFLNEETVFESNMMRFTVSNEVILPEYLIKLLQTAYAKAHILSNAKLAINQSSINQQDVKSFRVPVAPTKNQAEFAERAEQVSSIQSQQSAATAKAQAAFDALLAQVFC